MVLSREAEGRAGVDAEAAVQELQAMAEEEVPYGFLALGHHLVHGQHVQANLGDVGAPALPCSLSLTSAHAAASLTPHKMLAAVSADKHSTAVRSFPPLPLVLP